MTSEGLASMDSLVECEGAIGQALAVDALIPQIRAAIAGKHAAVAQLHEEIRALETQVCSDRGGATAV